MGYSIHCHAQECFKVNSAAGVLYSLRILRLCWPQVSNDRWSELIDTECVRRQNLGQSPVPLLMTPLAGVLVGSSSCDDDSRGASLKRSASASSIQALVPSALDSDARSQSSAGAHSQLLLFNASCSESSLDDSLSCGGVSSRLKAGWAACKDSLSIAHRSILIRRIEQLTERCSTYQSTVKKLRRENKALQRRNLALKERPPANSLALCSLDDQALEISKKKVRLTKRGFIAMGVRKALALTSAVSFPLAALVDTSRQTVARAENAVWSMLVARSGSWHSCIFDALRNIAAFQAGQANCQDPAAGSCGAAGSTGAESVDQLALVAKDLGVPDPSNEGLCASDMFYDKLQEAARQFCVGGTSLGSDATNSGIWKRNKLQTLLVTSSCMVQPKFLQSAWWRAFAHHTTLLLVHQTLTHKNFFGR